LDSREVPSHDHLGRDYDGEPFTNAFRAHSPEIVSVMVSGFWCLCSGKDRIIMVAG
jgi:hypothetical protein